LIRSTGQRAAGRFSGFSHRCCPGNSPGRFPANQVDGKTGQGKKFILNLKNEEGAVII
jgi:hypothetical protein